MLRFWFVCCSFIVVAARIRGRWRFGGHASSSCCCCRSCYLFYPSAVLVLEMSGFLISWLPAPFPRAFSFPSGKLWSSCFCIVLWKEHDDLLSLGSLLLLSSRAWCSFCHFWNFAVLLLHSITFMIGLYRLNVMIAKQSSRYKSKVHRNTQLVTVFVSRHHQVTRNGMFATEKQKMEHNHSRGRQEKNIQEPWELYLAHRYIHT
jgi:hypothetical protein